jgi:predicted transcriptional regulator of viral defense system
VLRTAEALRIGIHPRTLYQLREAGLIEAISRGVYRLASLPSLTHPDLVTVALRVPKGVICLISALAFHEITTEIPHEVQIALPRGTKSPKLDHPPLRVFRFSEPGLSLGIQTLKLDGIDVRIYDAAKTVVDCFRYRNKLGVDVAIEALKLCIERKIARPADLLRYARKCRAERVMLPYIEALQ